MPARSQIYVSINERGDYYLQYKQPADTHFRNVSYFDGKRKMHLPSMEMTFPETIQALFNLPEDVYRFRTSLKVDSHDRTPFPQQNIVVLKTTIKGITKKIKEHEQTRKRLSLFMDATDKVKKLDERI